MAVDKVDVAADGLLQKREDAPPGMILRHCRHRAHETNTLVIVSALVVQANRPGA